MNTALEIKDLKVRFGETSVLDGLDLELPAGAHGVVLGASGVGKSTLLRAVAGLVPAAGMIRIGESLVCAPEQTVPPERRGVGFLFQGLALWPHMSARQHLDFVSRAAGLEAEERKQRAEEILDALSLTPLAKRLPGQLSGGERQRLALARALVTRPALLLLDEPTSSVDPLTAREVRGLLARLGQEFGLTWLHVTHDQEEALELADRLYVMAEGRILQAGTPEDVYAHPTDPRVARFVGEGALLPGTRETGSGAAATPLGPLEVQPSSHTGAVWVLVRPEHLSEADDGEGVKATVRRIAFRGGRFLVELTVGDQAVTLLRAARPAPGETLRLRVNSPVPVVASRSSA